MASVIIRPMGPESRAAGLALWNELCELGQWVYSPLTEEAWLDRFCRPSAITLGAFDGETLAGYIGGTAPDTFLHGEDPLHGPGYLTAVLVQEKYRGQGIGRALFDALTQALTAKGKTALRCADANPVHVSWRIPGTPGHDHNNAPGADEEGMGFAFLQKCGMKPAAREMAMYRDLRAFAPNPEMEKLREELREKGIETGRYNPDWNCEFDLLCDRVGSEYWRHVLQTEIQALQTGKPNAVPEFWADGKPPKGPRPLLTATHGGGIIGFTGPVDRQESGRGWFTGICTDPEWGGQGIGSVLFYLLLKEFHEAGASFCTLFTGVENHAQKIYLRAGLRPVRRFTALQMPLPIR